MEYTTKGTISGLKYEGNTEYPNFINVETIVFNQKMPVLLEVIGTSIPKYLHKLYNTDCKEKHMKKRFTYSAYCLCTKIEVLDENEKVMKIVDLYSDDTKFLNFID